MESRAFSTVLSVSLENFRNYTSEAVTLSPGFNVISGPNGQGKTNFLESLYLLSTTRQLRGKRDSEMIQDGAERATVTAELVATSTQLGMQLERGSRKRALLNGLPLPRAADIIGRLKCVCVSSADMGIVRGEPSERRLFLDLELSAVSPAYLRHLALYKRATEQRNALLRDSRERLQASESFEVWEDQIAQHGAEIRMARLKFVQDLLPFASQTHQWMGGGEPLDLAFVLEDSAETYENLLRDLSLTRGQDIGRGSTSIGPHRDDMDIQVGGRQARLFGSQGQQRTAVISLKMATLALTRDRDREAPLLLLDDILSDLDEERRRNLIDIVLHQAEQAVLTCTEASSAGDQILSVAKLFTVDQGSIQDK